MIAGWGEGKAGMRPWQERQLGLSAGAGWGKGPSARGGFGAWRLRCLVASVPGGLYCLAWGASLPRNGEYLLVSAIL